MADEELKISAKNEEFVRKLTECQRVIQATKKEMDELYETQKKGFSDIGKADEYTKKMEALKKTLNDVTEEQKDLIESTEDTGEAVEDAGDSAGKSGESFKGFGKELVKITGIALLLVRFLKEVASAFLATAKGTNIATKATLIWKQAIYELATGFKGQSATIKELNQLADEMNKTRAKENQNLLENSDLQNKYNELLDEASSVNSTYATRKEKLNEAEDIYTKLIANQKDILREQIANTEKLLALQPENIDLKRQFIELQIQEKELTEKLRQGLEEIEGIRSAGYERDKQKFFEYLNKKFQQEEKYTNLRQKILEDAEKMEIKHLAGTAKLEAQRDFALKQIEELRNEIKALGAITPELEKAFAGMGRDASKAFNTGFSEIAKIGKKRTDDFIVSAILSNMPEDADDLITTYFGKNIDEVAKDIENTAKGRQEAMGDGFSLWSLLGLDPSEEDDEAMITALEKSAEKMQDVFDDILDQKVENAKRERELLDTRIAETQRALELEAELYMEGYANNLDAKRQELEALKSQREQAIKDEEAAIKKQQTYDKIIQTTSLLTSVAQILKGATKAGLIGLALAPFAIATLWAIWGKAKSSSVQLAEGGYGDEAGVITGKRHSQGGERFLDHVEVEHGESWGVLSRPASEKYGKVFHEIVNSFNKDQMPQFAPISNSVRVENSGPNSRLDKVITEQKRLNENLLKQSFITQVGGKRVVKQGNKVRIIG